jgi:hydroxymethylbilane synthase
MQSKILLGTRGSKLALAQADIVTGKLNNLDPSLLIEIVVIATEGDKDQKASLKDIGGKGVFIREIEQALLTRQIDIAVHSFKDITVQTAAGLHLSGFFKPESVCDVLISRSKIPFKEIAPGSKIGTGSMRRRALLRRMRSDLEYVDIRGNIDTRLSKVEQGLYAGILLSEAGLIRLGLTDRISERFDPEFFLPAPGQGVIAIQTRVEDTQLSHLCRNAGDEEQFVISSAEFAALECLGFDCRMPFGMLSRLKGDQITMNAFYEVPEKNIFIKETAAGSRTDPASIGRSLAARLLERL